MIPANGQPMRYMNLFCEGTEVSSEVDPELKPPERVASGGSRCKSTFLKADAMICKDCSFGARARKGVCCDTTIGMNPQTGKLCSSCSFGAKSDLCVKCGKNMFSDRTPAKLCDKCGFGQQKCCKM